MTTPHAREAAKDIRWLAVNGSVTNQETGETRSVEEVAAEMIQSAIDADNKELRERLMSLVKKWHVRCREYRHDEFGHDCSTALAVAWSDAADELEAALSAKEGK